MRQLGSFFHIAMNGMAASDKIFTLLDLPEDAPGSGTAAAARWPAGTCVSPTRKGAKCCTAFPWTFPKARSRPSWVKADAAKALWPPC